MENLYITDICKIYSQKIVVNNQLILEDFESTDISTFLKTAFKTLNYQYPKYYKMDNLSKLAVLASEPILSKQNTNNIALVFMNKSASLDTDLKHQQSIQNKDEYFPSPAVFVYTLPNICMGEVSIKHKLQTENAFFLSESFDAKLMFNYAEYLMKHKNVDKVLCGWIDVLQSEYQAIMYLVEKQGKVPHTINELDNITL
nr:3-oxoacyl-ACP synthase [uncultured Flavobacterium sp.]